MANAASSGDTELPQCLFGMVVVRTDDPFSRVPLQTAHCTRHVSDSDTNYISNVHALSASISTRVGNELGAGRPDKARLATTIAIALAFLVSLFGFVLTTLGRGAWGRVFTNDNEVLELTVAVLPIIGLCELANCPQTTCCGALRGSARPSIGAGINFCSFYIMGAPVAVALAFFWELGFLGLCYGLLTAQVVCVLSILMIIHTTDWENESLRAKDLVGESNEYVQADLLVKCEEGVGAY